MQFSLIIPVFNRPDEIEELLQSLVLQTYNQAFEVVVVEDGSAIRCESVVEKYQDQLQISYYYKPNSGPGDSRNFGMKRALANYFIILDSDCILPAHYLEEVEKALQERPVACFGGPDAAHASFSDIQKAIDFTMTAFLTTGGIRGGSEKMGKFQPRSFNMGISKEAFMATNGFQSIHPGEDPDLSIRLWEKGYETALFSNAYVYHKRRIDFSKFHLQVYKFGKARPILNTWYPSYSKPTFWLPSLFLLGFLLAIVAAFCQFYILLGLYVFYFGLIGFLSAICYKNSRIGVYTIYAAAIQFYGYGRGFLESYFKLKWTQKPAEAVMPEMFFRK